MATSDWKITSVGLSYVDGMYGVMPIKCALCFVTLDYSSDRFTHLLTWGTPKKLKHMDMCKNCHSILTIIVNEYIPRMTVKIKAI